MPKLTASRSEDLPAALRTRGNVIIAVAPGGIYTAYIQRKDPPRQVDYLPMALVISLAVSVKLANKTPPVTQEEISQCFANREGAFLRDTRERHQSDPPTQWFIGETDFGRKLKVAFIPRGGNIVIRTA